MSAFQLSLDPAHVHAARLISTFAARGFPTVATQWEDEALGLVLEWRIVTDYTLVLPPVAAGKFQTVRIAAFVGDAKDKSLYFGNEIGAHVPRIGPDLENFFAPAGFIEFHLDSETSPVPYVKLIQTTPRISGTGGQEYAASALKVERFDIALSPEQFPNGFFLRTIGVDAPRASHWAEMAYDGPEAIAVLRGGGVVGQLACLTLGQRPTGAPVEPMLVHTGVLGLVLDSEEVAVAFAPEGAASKLVPAGGSEVSSATIHLAESDRTLRTWRAAGEFPRLRFDEVCVGDAAKKRLAQSPLGLSVADLEDVAAKGATFTLPADSDNWAAPERAQTLWEISGYLWALRVMAATEVCFPRVGLCLPSHWAPWVRERVAGALEAGWRRAMPPSVTEQVAFDDVGARAMAVLAQAVRLFHMEPKGGRDESRRLALVDIGTRSTTFLMGRLRRATQPEEALGARLMLELAPPTVVTAGCLAEEEARFIAALPRDLLGTLQTEFAIDASTITTHAGAMHSWHRARATLVEVANRTDEHVEVQLQGWSPSGAPRAVTVGLRPADLRSALSISQDIATRDLLAWVTERVGRLAQDGDASRLVVTGAAGAERLVPKLVEALPGLRIHMLLRDARHSVNTDPAAVAAHGLIALASGSIKTTFVESV